MSGIEYRLIEAIQPIRQFFLAQVIEFSLRSGLFARMEAGPGLPIDRLAKDLDHHPDRLAGLLRYLAAEGIVSEPETYPALTARGHEYLTFQPWYELLIGGYRATLHKLPEAMADDRFYAGRDGAMVGKGSCGISRHDAIPLVRSLLDQAGVTPPRLVDLGCGDGTFLLDLCDGSRDGVGVDPYPPNIEAARAQAVARGHGERVLFVAAPAEKYVMDTPTEPGACFIAAFSLQEILEQRGRDAVISLVQRVLAPAGAYLAVVEVDHRPTDGAITRHGLGLAYYNPYYLLHQVTEQRLETAEFWRELFAEAGAVIVTESTVDAEVDSTGLEIGFLLTAARP